MLTIVADRVCQFSDHKLQSGRLRCDPRQEPVSEAVPDPVVVQLAQGGALERDPAAAARRQPRLRSHPAAQQSSGILYKQFRTRVDLGIGSGVLLEGGETMIKFSEFSQCYNL
jgi:hypothetical protein